MKNKIVNQHLEKSKAFLGFLLVGVLVSCIGCTNKENTESKKEASHNSDVALVETTSESFVKFTPVPDNESVNVKSNEYTITGGKSDFVTYVIKAGDYPEDSKHFAYEEDFDTNGGKEAFVVIGVLDENVITGDIWFVNDINEASLLEEDVSVNRQQQIYRGKKNTYLLLSYSKGNRLITKIYYVFEDWSGEAFSTEEYSSVDHKYLTTGTLVMVQSAYDHNYNKKTETRTGPTLKNYYYEFKDEHFESVVSEEKTKNYFKTYQNAEDILEELEKEYHPTAYQFIYRESGEWNVNIAVEDESSITFYYTTYLINDDNNTLTLREKGEGYYLLDMSNNYRDFLTILLNENNNNNLQTWLTIATKERMTNEEALQWYEQFQNDNIFMDNGYICNGLQVVDIDGNGEKDIFLLTTVDTNSLHMPNNPVFHSYCYVYMNKNSVYRVKHNDYEGNIYHFWYQDIVWGDVDHDGYLEIGYNIFTGGNGGAGSSYKGILKYRNNMLEEMNLPNDLDDDYGDLGLTVEVLAGPEQDSYVAYCPYLQQRIAFTAPNAMDENGNRIRLLKEGETAGGNVRGYYSLEVVEMDKQEYLLLKEFLHGEGGVNDGVGIATFLIDWNEKFEPYVKEFSVEGVNE